MAVFHGNVVTTHHCYIKTGQAIIIIKDIDCSETHMDNVFDRNRNLGPLYFPQGIVGLITPIQTSIFVIAWENWTLNKLVL